MLVCVAIAFISIAVAIIWFLKSRKGRSEGRVNFAHCANLSNAFLDLPSTSESHPKRETTSSLEMTRMTVSPIYHSNAGKKKATSTPMYEEVAPVSQSTAAPPVRVTMTDNTSYQVAGIH